MVVDMNIVIRVSEVREVSSCYHVKMGNISWVTEDASSVDEALGLFLATFISPDFEYELRDKYEVNGVIRYLYVVTLLNK